MTSTDFPTATAVESSRSALAWGPVIGGAFASAAASVILLFLGSGVGLTMVSANSNSGFSLAALGITAAIWFMVVQWLSSALGGYLTGRLRTKWAAVHTDEVFFRDTAHGFLSWAIATVFVIGFLSSALGTFLSAGASVVGNAAGAAGAVAASTAGAPDQSTTSNYFSNLLLRPDPGKPAPTANNAAAASAAVTNILVTGAANDQIPDDDKAYLASVVAQQTGLTQEEAKTRVDTVLTKIDDAKQAAKDAAEKARKAASTASLIAAASLLVGAFIACASAALGGAQRDEHEDLLIVR
jgi:hypothetical protein